MSMDCMICSIFLGSRIVSDTLEYLSVSTGHLMAPQVQMETGCVHSLKMLLPTVQCSVRVH